MEDVNELKRQRAVALDRDIELKLGTPEYHQNRRILALLTRQIWEAEKHLYSGADFTTADYDRCPDSVRSTRR